MKDLDAISRKYIEAMSDPKSLSDHELKMMATQVAEALDINLEDPDPSECAMAKFWLYLILGQNHYGRRIRDLFKSQDTCSVSHAKFVVSMVEDFFVSRQQNKIKGSRS